MSSKEIDSIERKLGELDGKVTMILRKLDNMERKYNGITEKVIRHDEEIDKIRKEIRDHINWHKKNTERKISFRYSLILVIITVLLSSLISFIMNHFCGGGT